MRCEIIKLFYYEKAKIFFFLVLFTCFSSYGVDGINGDTVNQAIRLSETSRPNKSHAIEVNEPVAMYCSDTDVLEITFDSYWYSHYTINLEGPYAVVDYFANSPTVYLPVANMGDVVEIYIESADCGSYYGVLDKTAFTSME